MATSEENQIDDFLESARAEEQPQAAPQPETRTEEQTVERKAREGGKAPASPKQKKTMLSGTELAERIAQDLEKNPTLNETDFRTALRDKVKDDSISEANYVAALNKELAKSEQEEQEEQQPAVTPPPAFKNTLEGVKNGFNQFSDWATSLKTPGGIAALVWILLFFLWVVVPVNNGKTRLQLLWGVLTGQYALNAESRAEEQKAAIPPNYTGTINVPPDELPYFQGSSSQILTFNPTSVTFEPV